MEQVQAEVEAELRSKAKSVNIIGFSYLLGQRWSKHLNIFNGNSIKKNTSLVDPFLGYNSTFSKKYRLYQVYQSVTNPLIRPVGTTP